MFCFVYMQQVSSRSLKSMGLVEEVVDLLSYCLCIKLRMLKTTFLDVGKLECESEGTTVKEDSCV